MQLKLSVSGEAFEYVMLRRCLVSLLKGAPDFAEGLMAEEFQNFEQLQVEVAGVLPEIVEVV